MGGNYPRVRTILTGCWGVGRNEQKKSWKKGRCRVPFLGGSERTKGSHTPLGVHPTGAREQGKKLINQNRSSSSRQAAYRAGHLILPLISKLISARKEHLSIRAMETVRSPAFFPGGTAYGHDWRSVRDGKWSG